MLALSLGAKTIKMNHGHHGANHPVKDLSTGKVEIPAMNHGFAVDPESLPNNMKITHTSLNDQTVEGLRYTDVPAFSVQYHPESSPGPHDSRNLFNQFVRLMDQQKNVSGNKLRLFEKTKAVPSLFPTTNMSPLIPEGVSVNPEKVLVEA